MDVTESRLPAQAARTVYQGHAGPGRAGDPAWLYPWLPLLPGRNALPSVTRERNLDTSEREGTCRC